MKHYIPFVLILMILVGCNQQSETMNQDKATTDPPAEELNEQGSVPDYDPAMDLTTMDVEGIEVLSDTLGVKMYIGTMQPGDSVGWHFHPDHTVYVIEGGTLEVYFKGMEKQTMELTSGVGFISPSLSDAAVNTGNTTIKLLTHDIYRPRE